MKLCCYNDNQIGFVEDGLVFEITHILEKLPTLIWPLDHGDHLIRHLDVVTAALDGARGEGVPINNVILKSPIANPSKIIAAPLNYEMHVEEAGKDSDIHHNTHQTKFEGYSSPIEKLGLFLKANSSLSGPGEGLELIFQDRRNDHEVELAVVIGTTARKVPVTSALDYVAGYCIGLDMSVRGTEDRSFRKSPDTYTVLGPYLVTADEVAAPGDLSFWLKVNGEIRQRSNTNQLTVGIPELVSLASHWYTLHPGDVILTGTPDGVGPVEAGDVIEASIERLGSMSISVSAS